MSNNDLQSILARHNLKGINVANFSQPRSHQPTPSRPQPYQYPAPVPQPQQVYQYPAVPRQQWAPPAEAATQQVRPSFAWPSAPQPQYTIDPRHYSYNIWGKAPVYSLTGEDENEDEEDGDEDEEEGEGESAGEDDATAAGEIDADAGAKAETSIEAEKAATEDMITEEDSAKTSITPLDSTGESATAMAGEAAAEPVKEESAPEPPSEAAPSSEEEATSTTTSQESDSVPEASQGPAAPAPSEEEARTSEIAEVAPASLESQEISASEESIEAVDTSTEEKASEEPVIAAALQDDDGSAADSVVAGDVTQQSDSNETAPGAESIEEVAGASEPAIDVPPEETTPEASPHENLSFDDPPSQDPSSADSASVGSPDKDTTDEKPQSIEPSSADQNAGTISEPEPDPAVASAPEPDSVAKDELDIKAVEQQSPATEHEEEPTEVVQVIDSTNTNDEPTAIVIDVGGEETTTDDAVVVIDIPAPNSDQIIDVPPPPPPAPHVTIAEPIRLSKLSSKKSSSKSSKSRQPEKFKEVKPVEIILLREGKSRPASKSKVMAKKSRGKVVEKAMKVFEDVPPPPPLVVAVSEDEVIDVPPPAPSPLPAGDLVEVVETEKILVVAAEANENSEEAVKESEDPPTPQDVSINSPEGEAAGHQDQDSVENQQSTPSDPEPNDESISTSSSDTTKPDVEQTDIIVAELSEPAQEAAVSAEPLVKDLAATAEGSENAAAGDPSAGNGEEAVTPPTPEAEAVAPAVGGSESIAGEPPTSVQEDGVSDEPSIEPATVDESAPEASGQTAPAEAAEIDMVDPALTEVAESIATATSDETVVEKAELVAESAPALLGSEAILITPGASSEHKDEIVEETETNKSAPKDSPADAVTHSEETAPADNIVNAEPDTDHADDGALAVIVHLEEEESIDADIDILPEAPMPPGSYMSDSEGESGGDDEDGGKEQDQVTDGKAAAELVPREEAEESAAAMSDEAVTGATNPVEETLMSVSDSSTVKPEAEKTETSDQVEHVDVTPESGDGANPVSPVETPDAAVDTQPADQDTLSPASDGTKEAEPKLEDEEQPELLVTNPDEQAPEDSKIEEEPVLVETSAALESEEEDASSPSEELGDTDSSETIDNQQAPPDQKPEDEATADGDEAAESDVAEEAADTVKIQDKTEPVATQESGEAFDAIEEPASTDGEAVVVAATVDASEQLPANHDTEGAESTTQPTVDEPAAEDPVVDGAVTEEPAAEVQEPITDVGVDEPATGKLAADATEEPVILGPAVEDSGDHEHTLTEASEPVADDSAHAEPRETTTEENVISDQEAPAEDNRPEQVTQTVTDYIPEPPAETTVEDLKEADDAASSTQRTICQEEGGTISKNPSLQMLVKDVQGDSAKELLKGRPAQSTSDHGDQDMPDPVPNELVVEKLPEPNEEPSPKLPSTSAPEEDVQEDAEPESSAPSHGFAEEEENFGPQDSISQRSVPVGIPPVGSVYAEHHFVPEVSGALPLESAAPSGSIPSPASRLTAHGPPAAPAPAPASRASVREPPASSRASKQPSHASPPKHKRKSSHSNGTTRIQVKDVSRPTGDPKAPVEILRRTTTKTAPPSNFLAGLGIKSSSSKSSRQPSGTNELKRKNDELDAKQRKTDREVENARQRLIIADKANRLREKEAELALLHQAERAQKREQERLAREALDREENAKRESSRIAEPERPAHRHRRRHTDRVSDSHRRHRDERPRARKPSSSHRDEQIREQSPVPQPREPREQSHVPRPREPREPRVRRYRAEEIGSERKRTDEVNGVDEVHTREEPTTSKRPEERRRRSHRESRKEEKPTGLFGSLKKVFKKL